MACTGFYLLLDNIVVSHGFNMGYALYRVPFAGNWNITGGGLLIPFMFGVAWIFYNARAPWGWILAAGSLAAIVLGVLMSLSITLQTMSLLNLITDRKFNHMMPSMAGILGDLTSLKSAV